MKNNNLILFAIPTLIWGSTWYAIKFQLGVVHPVLSVAYRFALAGILLLIVLSLMGYKMRFSFKHHMLMLFQGICLFGVNYWLVYTAELVLPSGLVAVIFSLIIFTNIILNAIILKGQIKRAALIGGAFGVVGTVFIFYNEIISFGISAESLKAIGFCLISLLLASVGNIISAYNQKQQIPVMQNNAYGMTYGALVMIVISLSLGIEFTFDVKLPYVMSLLYLSLLGSIVAFSSYLQLLGKIGSDKAAYAILIIPVFALIISSIFEGLTIHFTAIAGILMLLAGNALAMNNKFSVLLKRRVK